MAGFDETQANWWELSASGSHDKVYKEVIAIVKPNEHSTWLDLGCGGGEFLVHVLKMGSRAIGVDISPEMLQRAKTRWEHNGFTVHDSPDSRSRLVQASIVNLPEVTSLSKGLLMLLLYSPQFN